MKKIILLGGALCLFTSFSAGAQSAPSNFGEALAASLMYPQGAEVSRRNNNDQYWNRINFNQEMREREQAREEARKNGHGDNGHHYAYGKDPKHHKEGWKSPKKDHPKFHSGNRPKDPNKHNSNK